MLLSSKLQLRLVSPSNLVRLSPNELAIIPALNASESSVRVGLQFKVPTNGTYVIEMKFQSRIPNNPGLNNAFCAVNNPLSPNSNVTILLNVNGYSWGGYTLNQAFANFDTEFQKTGVIRSTLEFNQGDLVSFSFANGGPWISSLGTFSEVIDVSFVYSQVSNQAPPPPPSGKTYFSIDQLYRRSAAGFGFFESQNVPGGCLLYNPNSFPVINQVADIVYQFSNSSDSTDNQIFFNFGNSIYQNSSFNLSPGDGICN